MLSGNGRHRRPRQAPAFLVTAGVTSATVAIPLMSAGSAQAIEGETWDRVADCESGGKWSADTDNGYFGGLQLPLRLWLEFGGAEFADRPDLASRSQQIAVAERVLAVQGSDAFPACALSTGLRREHRAEADAAAAGEAAAQDGSGAAERADRAAGSGRGSAPGEAREPEAGTGSGAGERRTEGAGRGRLVDEPAGAAEVTGAAESDESAEESAPAEVLPEDGTGAVEDAAPGTGPETVEPSGPAGTPEPDGPAAPEWGAAGGPAAESPAEENRGGRHRGGSAEEGAEDVLEPGAGRHAAEAPAAPVYEVMPGDTLSAIAADGGVDGGWPALYEENEGVIGDDPDHILPGQLLELGASTSSD